MSTKLKSQQPEDAPGVEAEINRPALSTALTPTSANQAHMTIIGRTSSTECGRRQSSTASATRLDAHTVATTPM